MNPRNIRNRFTLVCFGLILCIVFLFVLAFTSFVLLYQERCQQKYNANEFVLETYKYKYLRIDSLTNSSKRGVLSLPIEPPLLESVTFEPSIGVHVLISNFGIKDEYYCTGSCFCEDENEDLSMEERRSSSSVPVVRGLLYLVSSLTSILAIKKADEYFSKECVLGLEDECPLNSIHSTVDECNSINFILEDSEEAEAEGNSKTKEPDTTGFRCSGRCTDSFVHHQDVFESSEMKKEFDSEFDGVDESEVTYLSTIFQTFLSVEVIRTRLYCKDLELTSKITVERKSSFETQEQRAINNFCDIHLHKFCKSNSYFTHDEIRERFLGDVPEGSTDPRPRRLWIRFHELYREKDSNSDGMNVCKAKKSNIFHVENEEGIRSNELLMVVCLREFTDEEWTKKIPYESQNLRHWKEGHRRKTDDVTEDMILQCLSIGFVNPIKFGLARTNLLVNIEQSIKDFPK